MPDNSLSINISIADRQYRIKVDPKEEQTVRQSVKLINDKIMEYKKSFPGKDMQDYISMVLVWFATENTNTGLSSLDKNNIMGKIDQIEKLINGELY